jgi:hypothetical protein
MPMSIPEDPALEAELNADIYKARLECAAPELLAALKSIPLRHMDAMIVLDPAETSAKQFENFGAWQDKVYALIARIEGGK